MRNKHLTMYKTLFSLGDRHRSSGCQLPHNPWSPLDNWSGVWVSGLTDLVYTLFLGLQWSVQGWANQNTSLGFFQGAWREKRVSYLSGHKAVKMRAQHPVTMYRSHLVKKPLRENEAHIRRAAWVRGMENPCASQVSSSGHPCSHLQPGCSHSSVM